MRLKCSFKADTGAKLCKVKKINVGAITAKLLLVSGISILGLGSRSPQALAQVPSTECRSAYDQTDCGYSCVAGHGSVRCTDWPGATCSAAYGRITCGPEAPSNWMDYYINYSQQRLRWEYQYFNGCSRDTLNEMGESGWEVVQVLNQGGNRTCSVLAKRSH